VFGGVGVACEAPLAATPMAGSGRGGVPRRIPRLTSHWSRRPTQQAFSGFFLYHAGWAAAHRQRWAAQLGLTAFEKAG